MIDLADGPALLISGEKITASHRARDAYVYVRQSTLLQARVHTESLARQYDLRQRATALGWPAHQVVVIDEDLGRSGASAAGRSGFSELVADVGLGRAGIILALEVSRLARSNALFRYRNKAFCSACRFMPRMKPEPWPRMEGAGVEAE
jgi:hypothetical protein